MSELTIEERVDRLEVIARGLAVGDHRVTLGSTADPAGKPARDALSSLLLAELVEEER